MTKAPTPLSLPSSWPSGNVLVLQKAPTCNRLPASRRAVVAAVGRKPPKVGAGPVPFRKSKWARRKESEDPNSARQRQWEALMSAILNDEDNAGQALQAAREGGWLQRSDIVGALVRLKQLQRWGAVLQVRDGGKEEKSRCQEKQILATNNALQLRRITRIWCEQ